MYQVMKHDRNSWHPDGSPVIWGTYYESTRWRDIIRWYENNHSTTAILDSYLYINGQYVAFLAEVMNLAQDRPTVTMVKEFYEIGGN